MRKKTKRQCHETTGNIRGRYWRENWNQQKKILYRWLASNEIFRENLEILKDVRENDPFKTGTDEGTLVNSMKVAVLLMETSNRHFKSGIS